MRFKNRWDTPASLEFVFVSLYLLYFFFFFFTTVSSPSSTTFHEAFPGAFLFVWIPCPLRNFVVDFFDSYLLSRLVIFCVSLNGVGRPFLHNFFLTHSSILTYYSPMFSSALRWFFYLDTWGMRFVSGFPCFFGSLSLSPFLPSVYEVRRNSDE